jgi:predicted transcriptional regulator
MTILAKNGLIEIVVESPTIYRTTNRGQKALSHLKAIKEMISE